MEFGQILKQVREVLKEEHFTLTYAGRRVPSEIIKIRNREGKVYLTVATMSWPSEHEQCFRSFQTWLDEKIKPFGWRSHITSGGSGEWTFRINSDIYKV